MIDIKSVNINLTKINSNNIVNSKDGMNFFITNGLFYKIIDKKNINYSKYLEELNKIERAVSILEKAKLESIDGICIPLIKLYYNGQFVGYATRYLEGYKELIEAASFFDVNKKIDLLIQLSKTIKELHDHNIVHSDIYNNNVLTDGNNIKIIDFDECCIFKEGEEVSYFNSPYADIAQINDLFRRLLIKNNKIILDNCEINIPGKIKQYLYENDIHDYSHYGEIVRVTKPLEYPHDWLEELKKYSNTNDKVLGNDVKVR
ncbi:MAG: protein kinase family protein [Mollicutes bacterium]|nr:protein kinase family protein [Mollicutes bacterium]